MADKFELWECPECHRRILAPKILNYRGLNEFKVTEYKCSCNTDLKKLGDDWMLYPNDKDALIAFKWR